jgi:hypothetical protein
MKYICESVKSQSEIILRLEDVGRRQNKLIHQLKDKVEDLCVKLHPEGSPVESSQPPPRTTVIQSGARSPPGPPTNGNSQPAHNTDELNPSRRQVPAFRPALAPKGKRKILYIRDSIHRMVVGPKLENPTGSMIRSANAYASVRDERAPANKQHLNVSEVVRQELAKSQGEDALVLGAPSVDITNQDTSRGITDMNRTETIASSLAMVEAGEYAIKTGKAKQAILLQHIPRYDVEQKDKDKAELAKMANKEMLKARDASEFAEHMFVGKHTGLECEGATRTSRFTSDHTNGLHGKNIRMGKYDGLHMYSQAGAEALTESILNIFHKTGLVKRRRPASSPSIQGADKEPTTTWPVQGTRNAARNLQVPVWEIPTQNRFQGFC